ncbi:HAMP domain-containing sensor histidine kinase [Prevotella sp. E2-28]|uniref:sensor histidine kinase n=1 Tax=Prevotella sp. E2-28 TaxID=2913620 RepID=UPI001EDB5966|nr:HAMP domain-containing sensor histidine kinase [Prevotella sp. E2-28]UKK54943.1 HAMP domain-containing histidine kinase [Prevotella sp. E2-28]
MNKRLLLLIALHLSLITCFAQGLPFLRNFSANEYQAHNRNFDITTDDKGFVYVANFEGLLYYDQAEWRIIHTPNITRITTLYRDAKGTIWAGGYNYLGFIKGNERGDLILNNAVEKGSFQGVISQIWENGKQMVFQLEDGNVYTLDKGEIKEAQQNILNTAPSNELVDLGFGLKAKATEANGVEFLSNGMTAYFITEDNGLCSNAINKLAYNGKGILWGATNNGLFCIAVPTTYTHSTAQEGLRGEALSILYHEGTLYAGTTNGLFYMEDKFFHPVANMSHQCWQMITTKKGLLVATSNGLYLVNNKNNAKRLNNQNTMSVKEAQGGFYTGEPDGVYLNGDNGSRKKIADLERVTQIYMDEKGAMWLQNLYGIIWCKKAAEKDFHQVILEGDKTVPGMIVPTDKGLLTISANQTEPIPYPQMAYKDKTGTTWLTNSDGRGLYCIKDGNRQKTYEKQLNAISEYNVRDMLLMDDRLIMGGDFGLITYRSNFTDPILESQPKLFIRTVKLNGDSILWGGYGEMPKNFKLSSDERNLEFTFGLDNTILIKKTLYRYRQDNQPWSAWDDEQEVKFTSLNYGSHTFEVQAMDAYGNITQTEQLKFTIQFPFYQRWYMLISYFLLFVFLLYAFAKRHVRQLEKEKQRLENIVQERTAEVVKQKDEIEEKSKSLQTALNDLAQAQNELIRQEKMATAGKLTQGLIDRILNPLNYINNFAKLSEGLAKDIKANIEDEKDNMSEDNYEDTMDVLDMLIGNLQKVSEHGQNNTRILKAMEEMLKDRSGGIKPMDLVPVLNQDKEMTNSYFAEKIKEYSIKVNFNIPQESISINGNPEQLSMTLMSMLGNAVYAVVKKAQREKYDPEITLSVDTTADHLTIAIRDNGIGIEDTIINKVFDPFFTTKPTGEAAGVGLYLSREIIQNHSGDISVKSEKDVYTEFTITLPISQN